MAVAALNITGLFCFDQQESNGDDLYFKINGKTVQVPETVYEAHIYPLTPNGIEATTSTDGEFVVQLWEDDPAGPEPWNRDDPIGKPLHIPAESTNGTYLHPYFSGSGGEYQVEYEVFWLAN